MAKDAKTLPGWDEAYRNCRYKESKWANYQTPKSQEEHNQI